MKNTRFAFSYDEYLRILNKFRPDLKSFADAARLDAFAILRHDVEFSVTRAHRMACFEQENGVNSTFFFQVCSSAYNPFSAKNKTLIDEIKAQGHSVGLHLYVSHVPEDDWEQLGAELQAQKSIFETGLGLACSSFSFHRPQRWVLEHREDKLEGLINAYGASFFEFSHNPSQIKYIADSKHQWSYGHPLEDYDHKKIQILIHPDEWSEDGHDAKRHWQSLIDEHRAEFIDTLDGETKVFGQYREELE